ncbi:MAG: rRNA processing protein RimM [Frankiaceae bacterium]|nr:rRNA processing protein RimM [Frankiaceae bacterium]MDX6224632.1 rRNA processing protein RimM [Frankiales bacterium]MDX6273290.1 rRNA processing protein RimM [Frankiales bacterium]
MQLVVGRIGRAHGIRGEVTVEVRTDDPDERFAEGASLITDPPERGPLTVERAWWHSGRLVLKLLGVEDRNGAEALRNTLIVVDSADLEPIDDPDEWRDHELEGLRVELVDGTAVGELKELLHLPGQDVLVVERADAPEVLVPFVRAMVPVVDVLAGKVVIDPPPGLLDEVE